MAYRFVPVSNAVGRLLGRSGICRPSFSFLRVNGFETRVIYIYSLGLLCLGKDKMRMLIKFGRKRRVTFVTLIGSAITVDAQHYLMVLKYRSDKNVWLILPLGLELPPALCLARFRGIAA